MILNNSNTKTFLLFLTLFMLSCGGSSSNNTDDSIQVDTMNNTQDEVSASIENNTDEQSSNKKANIEAVSYTHLTLPTKA